MALSLADTGRSVAEALAGAHLREDVETYVSLFAAGATWITSRGVLFKGRDDLRDYLGRVMPGGLAGGSVSYRLAETIAAGDAVVVVIDQEYRDAGGELKADGGRHRHTYVVTATEDGWEIVAGQNTTVAGDNA